jgi:hypothetical protein
MRHAKDGRAGHAWVTVTDRPDLSAGEAGYIEAFVWEGSGS